MVASVDDGPTVWFITRVDSTKVGEIYGDHRALAVLKGAGKYLCVRGRADVLQDAETARRIWSERHRIQFTGPDDFHLALVRFQPEFAEYWDQSGVRGIKFALKAAKAYVTGEPLTDREDVEQHGVVHMGD
jgi:general stress protein 26